MKPLTVVIPYRSGPFLEKTLLPLTGSGLTEEILIASQEPVHFQMDRCRILVTGPLPSQETLGLILAGIQTKYLLLLPVASQVIFEPENLEKMLEVAESTRAGVVYSDFYDEADHKRTLHPLNDYQSGSVRDEFDFGAAILFSVPAVREALDHYGVIPGLKHAGLYDLRLKVSVDHPFYHVREPLYSVLAPAITGSQPSPDEKRFAYVDPRNETVQKEMEIVFTDYLKRIEAYLPPDSLREAEPAPDSFPVEASVIIPVRNRKMTIADAVESALAQETDFPFNLIVVDNHSADGTTAVLSRLASRHPALKHVIPERTDLGIGGCWNEALHHAACGRYAVQLDSDDLYSGRQTLQKIIRLFHQGRYAMVIGSYTLVDSELRTLPPGLIDHREWTDQNGHNNALRISGLGAPRAFDTRVMRRIGFLNASYGEDYAAALRICREYRVGRIYESLYLCRRWAGNTDAGLGLEEANRNDAFKDRIRSEEILGRQRMNRTVRIPQSSPARTLSDKNEA
jgi:hypothetical protein